MRGATCWPQDPAVSPTEALGTSHRPNNTRRIGPMGMAQVPQGVTLPLFRGRQDQFEVPILSWKRGAEFGG
jgi:hypothetical protein